MYICIYINVTPFLSIPTFDLTYNLDQYNINYYNKNLSSTQYIIYSSNLKKKYKSKKSLSNKINSSTTLNLPPQTALHYEFKLLTHNLFKYFFSSIHIEIPKTLINISSLSRETNQMSTIKLVNYVMVHGKFLKFLKGINYAWNLILKNYFHNINNTSWLKLYRQLSTYTISQAQLPPNLKLKTSLNLPNLLTSFIGRSYPIFSLYIYKVSKNIYKNTRGKSGKFMFVWKYIPLYKRALIVISWLIKELRSLPQRKLYLRLYELLSNISYKPKKTWAYRVKSFSYNYVYRNCRKGLAVSYLAAKV